MGQLLLHFLQSFFHRQHLLFFSIKPDLCLSDLDPSVVKSTLFSGTLSLLHCHNNYRYTQTDYKYDQLHQQKRH